MTTFIKQVFTLDAWKIFAFILLPMFFPDNLFGFILAVGFASLFLYWAYNLGTELYSKLPGGHTLNLNRFKFFLIIPCIYFLLVLFFMNGGYSINSNNIDDYGPIAFVIIPMHLFSMYCMFYCIYFLSKAIVCIDKQNKNVQAADYIGYCFGFWVFPIGIWFIQPKIKQIFTDY